MNIKRFVSLLIISAATFVAVAQTSTATLSRGKRSESTSGVNQTEAKTRMALKADEKEMSDADRAWSRVVYRELGIESDDNAPLFYPEDATDGEENLFRLMLRLVAAGKVPAYEYVDGKESFTATKQVDVKEMLNRFRIPAEEGRGSSVRAPRYEVADVDVPSAEVRSYYMIERWEFDLRTSRKRVRVEALCPVLHRANDWGVDVNKLPMFWVKYSDLKPYLSGGEVVVSDVNTQMTATYDELFTLGLYKGDIYMLRGRSNRPLVEMYPDAEARSRAADSIQASLERFGTGLGVPSPEELRVAQADSITVDSSAKTLKKVKSASKITRRGELNQKPKTQKFKNPGSKRGAATKSVRKRRR